MFLNLFLDGHEEGVNTKLRITKKQFDILADELNKLVTSEIEKVKENIDVNDDGYVDFREFKIVIKSIIKALKYSVRGLR